MIEWNNRDTPPEAGKNIILKLNDGRVCSAIVTDTLGIELQYVDSIDLFSQDSKWIYNE